METLFMLRISGRIGPSKWLCDRSSSCVSEGICNGLAGILPVNLFLQRSNSSNDFRLPSVVGSSQHACCGSLAKNFIVQSPP
jgi:hypothetical protein